MKPKLLLLIFALLTSVLHSQEAKRIKINGKVIVQSDELEGISIINTFTNQGTATNSDGEFEIIAGLNDVLLVHALQFEDFKAVVTEGVLTSKRMVVYLMEEVNKLDEILILPYDLTGYLDKDVNDIKTFNPDMNAIYFGIKNSDEYEFRDDYKSRVETNIAMHSQTQPIIVDGLNVANIVGLFLKKKKKSKRELAIDKLLPKNLKDYYSEEDITKNFNIPKDRINGFIDYLEKSKVDYSLLEKGKEIEFLEFVSQKSQQFLLTQSGKN